MASPAFMPACTALLVAAVLFPSSRENCAASRNSLALLRYFGASEGDSSRAFRTRRAVTWLALSAWAMTLSLSARLAPPLFARSAQPLFAQRPPLELLVPSLPA